MNLKRFFADIEIELHEGDVLPEAVRERAIAYYREELERVLKYFWNGRRMADLCSRTARCSPSCRSVHDDPHKKASALLAKLYDILEVLNDESDFLCYCGDPDCPKNRLRQLLEETDKILLD